MFLSKQNKLVLLLKTKIIIIKKVNIRRMISMITYPYKVFQLYRRYSIFQNCRNICSYSGKCCLILLRIYKKNIITKIYLNCNSGVNIRIQKIFNLALIHFPKSATPKELGQCYLFSTNSRYLNEFISKLTLFHLRYVE